MADISGNYWQGADGNYYLKASNVSGVVNLGASPSNNSDFTNLVNSGQYSQIADPNPPAQVSGGGTGTGTDTAAYDQAIGNTNAAINRLPGQQTTGEANIQTAYQNALDQLLSGKNVAQQSYNTNQTQTGQDYVGSKNTVNANAGNSLNGLLRLLGSRGAGGGSAFNTNAPEAVTREATLQRGGLGQTYGRNMGALDTNWNNYMTNYGNSVLDVGNQRDTQKSTLEDQIRTNQANLLQTLAQLTLAKTGSAGNAQPYVDQANALLNQVGTTKTPAINYNVAAYNAPTPESYTSSVVTPTVQGQGATNDYTSPFLQALLGKKNLNNI